MAGDETDGLLRITLKDVYQAQQAGSEKFSAALNAINLTMTEIRSHLERVDTRNLAADELHRDQADRIRAIEHIIDVADPRATKADVEERLRRLESTTVSRDAVDSYQHKATVAGHQAKRAQIAAIAAIVSAVGVLIAAIALMRGH